ncbi:hypothetical protein GCM10010218_64260 [Streptomyces mashuensis]|uniref:Uncharacterized protein n=1 Tax=Streptomyces mashuensis TaxID=33904 RepID=A0A919EGU0_9ACTN|nr:hypothetical protein [Streptomyces mashuensis]GHF74276.1 hypothetical protein GCM10010218_64260 [Streptomyces mashuensis]
MQKFAGLRVAGGTVRARTPYGWFGSLEVLFSHKEPQVGHRIGALPEGVIYDYTGIDRNVDMQHVWFVKDDKTPPGRYEIEHLFPTSDRGWAVIAKPSGAVAACRMKGEADYLGTREQAQQWADALNEKFPVHG